MNLDHIMSKIQQLGPEQMLFLVVILFLAEGIISKTIKLIKLMKFNADSITTTATVKEIERHSGIHSWPSHKINIEYQDQMLKKYTTEIIRTLPLKITTNPTNAYFEEVPKIGEQIDIIYIKDKPEQINCDKSFQIVFHLIGIAVFILVVNFLFNKYFM